MQRMTLQRQIILDELQRVKTHPTADELYEKVRVRLPHVSLGTVYRNLDVLSRSGAILKLAYSGSQCRFDGMTNDHYHVRCVLCASVEDVTELPEGFQMSYPERLAGYQITGRRLEFLGYCPQCQRRSTEKGVAIG